VFEEEFDRDTLERNFNFYEPRTVHESSLSPCVHSILAARLGRSEKAYEMYLRTSRLDLDDYNREVHEGLHITSMGGTWMSVVYGFGGMSIKEGLLCFDPALPENWEALSFKILYRGQILQVSINKGKVSIENLEGEGVDLYLLGSKKHLGVSKTLIADL
jgi:maltose phosphorylase